jgi:hypothetical protein
MTTLPGAQPLTPEQVAQSIFSLNYSLRDQGHTITLREVTSYNTQQIQQLSPVAARLPDRGAATTTSAAVAAGPHRRTHNDTLVAVRAPHKLRCRRTVSAGVPIHRLSFPPSRIPPWVLGST